MLGEGNTTQGFPSDRIPPTSQVHTDTTNAYDKSRSKSLQQPAETSSSFTRTFQTELRSSPSGLNTPGNLHPSESEAAEVLMSGFVDAPTVFDPFEGTGGDSFTTPSVWEDIFATADFSLLDVDVAFNPALMEIQGMGVLS
jgi:hypothetical protein